jgi:hypothetical protein
VYASDPFPADFWQMFYQTGPSTDGSMHFAADGAPELHVGLSG